VVAPPVLVKAHVGWVRMNKHLNVLTHVGHMESPNLVASCVNELDNTLPCFMRVQWDSVRAIHGMSVEDYVWKTVLGRGRTCPNFLASSWTVAACVAFVAHVCRVVRFIPLQGWLLIRISVTPLDMGDGLFVESKCRIINFIYCDDNYMDGDDYLVVMVYVNKYCLDIFSCLE
jgi:hypothetical protein